MTYDYAVIGAGVSGMTAALILAKHGYSVALIEKSQEIAPTIRGFMRKGLFFDTGFHYTGSLEPGEPLNTLFTYLGISDLIKRTPFNQDGFDSFRCLDPEVRFDYPCGYDRITERFHAAFPGEHSAIDTYFSSVRKLYYSTPYINFGCEPAMERLISAPETSLEKFLDGITGNTVLKCILSMHCFLYGVSPEEAPFVNHANIVGSYYESANGISGGGLSLVKAFEQQLKRMDVHIYRGEEINSIHLSPSGELSGVIFGNGNRLDCTGCISTIHPRSLLSIVPSSVFRPSYAKRLQELEETSSACILYAACSKPVEDVAGSNLFLFSRPDFDCFHNDTGPEQKPLYITASGTDHGNPSQNLGFIAMSPMTMEQAKSLIDIISNGNREKYAKLKEDISKEMLTRIRRLCPDVARNITDIVCATPFTLRKYTNSPFGSLYGVKHRIGQVNPLPPTRLKGLFVAGQAVTAPGIMGAMLSAFLVGGSIVGHQKLQEEIRNCRQGE